MSDWQPEIAYLLGGLTVLLLAWIADRVSRRAESRPVDLPTGPQPSPRGDHHE